MIRSFPRLLGGLYVMVALSVASLSQAVAGGFVGAGGGGVGVACFPTKTLPANLENHLTTGQMLSEAEIAQIQSLVTLDAWDAGQELTFNNLQGKSRTEVLDEVSRQIDDVSPILSFRLRQLEPSMIVKKWTDLSKDPAEFGATNDAHPRLALPDNCRLVQLAVRKTDVPDGNREIIRRLPKVAVTFDPRLFARLDAMNQAMLIVHEELYLMARSLGHPNSDEIRQLVAYFFSDSFLTALTDHRFRTRVQDAIVGLLGDYMLYFAEEPVKGSPGQSGPYTQLSRYHSYISALTKLRAQVHECRLAGGETAACRAKVMSPVNQARILNREEIFVMFADMVLNRRRVNMRSSEYLVIPFQDQRQLTLAARNLTDSCTGAFDNRMDFAGRPELYPYLDEAVNYCVDAIRAHAFGVFHDLKATLATVAVNGDAIYLAALKASPGPALPPGTQASRQRNFLRVLHEIATRAQACAQTSQMSFGDCVKAENEPTRLAEWVSEEEAFLLYTHYEFDDGYPGMTLPTNFLRSQIADGATKQAANKFFIKACEQTLDAREEASGTSLEKLMDKAMSYCLETIRSKGKGYEDFIE